MTTTTYDPLYKKDSKGKVRIWYVEREVDKYRTIAGIKDGNLVTSAWKTATPKNVGRSNETTAEVQAMCEVDSMYDKKLAQGSYHSSLDQIGVSKYFEPMLAKKYAPLKLFKDVHIQPKLDGMRCIADSKGLWTRKGKRIVSCPHVEKDLADFFERHPEAILDGELYNHALKDDFGKIMSLCRKSKPTSEDLQEAEDTVEYWLYDYPSHEGPFHERYETLRKHLNKKKGCSLIYTPSVESANPKDLTNDHESNLRGGFEGSMVRLSHEGSVYQPGKRSPNLLKWKEFMDDEFIVVCIEEGEGNRAGMAGSIKYLAENGEEFNSGIKGGVEYYKSIWKNKDDFVGGTGTVEYFELSKDGIPRFPVTVDLQPDGRDD